MLFQYTFSSILQGQKTQTRRLVKDGDVALRGRYNRIEAVIINGRKKWWVGKTYAVQPGRGEQQIARIRLLAINRQKVSQISQTDAQAEGFSNKQEFLLTWAHIHGDEKFDVYVWVLKFELETVCVDLNTFREITVKTTQLQAH